MASSSSSLTFKVNADTGSATAGFKRFASSLLGVQKAADKTNASLGKIGSKKPKLDVNDRAIKRAEAEIIRDPERVLDFGKDLTTRYSEGIDSIEGDAAEAMKAQAAKRVAIRFEAKRVASWDHRKLGGTY